VLPTGTVPFQSGNGGGTDAFVAKISSFTLPTTTTTTATPVSLLYFSYLGGSGNDTGLAIALDPLQDARVVGWTDSSNFPTQTPVYAASGGLRDAFVANLSTTSDVACTPSATVHCPGFSSYLGGNGIDMATSIALDLQDANYVAGETTSTNFPLQGALQGTLDGLSDAFVTKLSPLVSLAMTAAAPSAIKRSRSAAGARAVMKITGMFAVLGFSRRRASAAGPSMSDIMTSRMMRSGVQPGTAASASSPLPQLITTNSDLKPSESSSRIRGSSSTWRMRNVFTPAPIFNGNQFPRAVFARQRLIFSWRSTALRSATTYHGVARAIDSVTWYVAGDPCSDEIARRGWPRVYTAEKIFRFAVTKTLARLRRL
jgi:hypothetical protein